jgi:hypothetical protein
VGEWLWRWSLGRRTVKVEGALDPKLLLISPLLFILTSILLAPDEG